MTPLNIMLAVHVEIAPMRQFQRAPTTYDTEKIRETILKLMLIKYHAHCWASLQHVKLPLSMLKYLSLPVTICQIVYIYMTALSSKCQELSFC